MLKVGSAVLNSIRPPSFCYWCDFYAGGPTETRYLALCFLPIGVDHTGYFHITDPKTTGETVNRYA